MQLIAEVKTHSLSGWESSRSWEELFAIANEVGDMISIHTNPRWHGSFDLLKKARAMTEKPILAKGIHASDGDIARAVETGADKVLVVGRLPGVYLEKCLIEPNSFEELSALPPDVQAVWNSRDLDTDGFKEGSFADARKLFPGWLCQASNILSLEDINPSAQAVIIGQQMPEIAPQWPQWQLALAA